MCISHSCVKTCINNINTNDVVNLAVFVFPKVHFEGYARTQVCWVSCWRICSYTRLLSFKLKDMLVHKFVEFQVECFIWSLKSISGSIWCLNKFLNPVCKSITIFDQSKYFIKIFDEAFQTCLCLSLSYVSYW